MRALWLVIALALSGCFGGPMDRVCFNTVSGGSIGFAWDHDISKMRETLTADGWVVNATEEPFSPIDFTTMIVTKGNVTGGGMQISGGADPVRYSFRFVAPQGSHTKEDAERALGTTLHELQERFGGTIEYTGEGYECH